METEAQEKKPEWVKMKPAEVEKIIVELANKGESTSKIGLILRDNYGIPKAKLLGKKISKVLADNKIESNKEKARVTNKISTLQAHLARHKHDKNSKKSLQKNLWIANKLK